MSRRTFTLSMGALTLVTALVMSGHRAEEWSLPRDLVVADAPEGPITQGEIVNGRSDIFAGEIRAALGNRLAGLWITNDTTYNVGVVRPTDADRSMVADVARRYGAIGVVVAARYSAVELGRFRVALDRIPLKMWTRSLCSEYGDPTTNKIRVVLRRHDEALIRRIREIVPADALSLVVDREDCGLVSFSETAKGAT